MSLERIVCKDREDWLARRGKVGIGASEVAAICGLSPWMTAIDLWNLKTGLTQPKDLSDNEAVQLGVRMEPAIRGFFAAAHPEFTVDYHAFDILRQKERPNFFATLDGELIAQDGRRGILEIKTVHMTSKAAIAEWSNGRVKPAYYVQCLAQLLATGYDFVYLFAAMYFNSGDITLREYQIDRADVEADLAELRDTEDTFWSCVTEHRMPPMPLKI